MSLYHVNAVRIHPNKQTTDNDTDDPITIHPRTVEAFTTTQWTNSILQQLKRTFWKIADALFRSS
jgi:hypothetical protein